MTRHYATCEKCGARYCSPQPLTRCIAVRKGSPCCGMLASITYAKWES